MIRTCGLLVTEPRGDAPSPYRHPMTDSPPAKDNVLHALNRAADTVTQQLADSAGRTTTEVEVVAYLLTQEPATIPEVAEGIGHGYRKARDLLADLRTAGLVLRWQSGSPARFALTDAGRVVAEQMNAAVWTAITSAHGWPAAVITGEVMRLLSVSALELAPVKAPDSASRLSDVNVAAQFIGVEPRVIEAGVRSGTLPPPPWSEHDLQGMKGLRGSVAAVWPELLDRARQGQKFVNVANRVGLTTQKVASAIGRDPKLRAELDEALIAGRDPRIHHGRRLAYRQGCWCPDCRRAQLGS